MKKLFLYFVFLFLGFFSSFVFAVSCPTNYCDWNQCYSSRVCDSYINSSCYLNPYYPPFGEPYVCGSTALDPDFACSDGSYPTGGSTTCPAPTTQTCWDGSEIPAIDTCPVQPPLCSSSELSCPADENAECLTDDGYPANKFCPPTEQTCESGQVIPIDDTCPAICPVGYLPIGHECEYPSPPDDRCPEGYQSVYNPISGEFYCKKDDKTIPIAPALCAERWPDGGSKYECSYQEYVPGFSRCSSYVDQECQDFGNGWIAVFLPENPSVTEPTPITIPEPTNPPSEPAPVEPVPVEPFPVEPVPVNPFPVEPIQPILDPTNPILGPISPIDPTQPIIPIDVLPIDDPTLTPVPVPVYPVLDPLPVPTPTDPNPVIPEPILPPSPTPVDPVITPVPTPTPVLPPTPEPDENGNIDYRGYWQSLLNEQNKISHSTGETVTFLESIAKILNNTKDYIKHLTEYFDMDFGNPNEPVSNLYAEQQNQQNMVDMLESLKNPELSPVGFGPTAMDELIDAFTPSGACPNLSVVQAGKDFNLLTRFCSAWDEQGGRQALGWFFYLLTAMGIFSVWSSASKT